MFKPLLHFWRRWGIVSIIHDWMYPLTNIQFLMLLSIRDPSWAFSGDFCIFRCLGSCPCYKPCLLTIKMSGSVSAPKFSLVIFCRLFVPHLTLFWTHRCKLSVRGWKKPFVLRNSQHGDGYSVDAPGIHLGEAADVIHTRNGFLPQQ